MASESFRELFDAAPDPMVVMDPSGRVVMLNRQGQRVLGWNEAELAGEPLSRLIPLRYHHVTQANGLTVGLVARRQDGSEFPAEFHRSPLGAGLDALVVVTIRDLTQLRRSQDALFREKEQAAVTLASIADGVVTTDVSGAITYLNPTAERLSGWRLTEALGQPLSTVIVLLSEATRQPVDDITARCVSEERAMDLGDGVVLLRRDGTELPVGDSAAPLRDRNGAVIGVVMVFHDATDRRRATRALTYEATHDALTGLVSRREFERRLARVLAEVAGGTTEHALCYLDLDRFKQVNDGGGHEAGDDLLRAVAQVIRACVGSRDTAARVGGDEFAVLLEHCVPARAIEVAEQIRHAIDDFPFAQGGRTYALAASIGVVPITPESGRSGDALRAADDACYVAKDAGGNRVHLASPDAGSAVRRLVERRRVARLTRAMEAGRCELYAQPIIPLARLEAARPRCEILLRLPDELGGLDAAVAILPQAERHRLTPAIDRWVINQAVLMVAQWHRDHPDCELPLCSINLSAASLYDGNLIAALRDDLAQQRLPPEALSFEIDEATAFGNVAKLAHFIGEVRATGCGVGLDHFGNGPSSFAPLKALALDFVKIGAHYVRGIEDPVYGTLVSTVSQIGRIRGMDTIAGQVDRVDVLPRLRDLGVGFAQGHAVAPPQPLSGGDGEVALPCVLREA